MADEAAKPTGPHTVRAGVIDTLLGNKGRNGELLRNGKPVLVEDLPDDDDEDDQRPWPRL